MNWTFTYWQMLRATYFWLDGVPHEATWHKFWVPVQAQPLPNAVPLA